MIEGLSVETAEYILGDEISSQEKATLSKTLSAIEGIGSTEIRDRSVSVQYYPDILSKEMIRGELVRLGVSIQKNGKPRKPLAKFINRLAEANTKTFGSEPLDCCKLNSKARPEA